MHSEGEQNKDMNTMITKESNNNNNNNMNMNVDQPFKPRKKSLTELNIEANAHDSTFSSIYISWFEPTLSLSRKVTAYEVQQCMLTGPILKSMSQITEFELSGGLINGNNNNNDHKETQEEFETIEKDVKTNSLIVNRLRGGGQYLFRVRPQINYIWCSWNIASISEVINIPAARPDAPFDLKPATMDGYEEEEEEEEENLMENNEEMKEKNEERVVVFGTKNRGMENKKDIINNIIEDRERQDRLVLLDQQSIKVGDNTISSLVKPIELNEETGGQDIHKKVRTLRYDIQHDNVVIRWTNGKSNGSAIVEYEVYCAMIHIHNPRHVMIIIDGGEVPVINKNGLVTTTMLKINDDQTITKSNGRDDDVINHSKNHNDLAIYDSNDFVWTNVTLDGDILGPQAFRVKNLCVGTSYVFCVRQRNDIGWSAFSKPSSVITTTMIAPPSQPIVILTNPYDAVIQWYETNITCSLEYIAQVGALPPTYGLHNNENNENDDTIQPRNDDDEQFVMLDVIWKESITRKLNDEEQIMEIINTPILDNFGNKLDNHVKKVYPGRNFENRKDDNNLLFSQILIQQLSPGSFYTIRVKVRSITGWSVWSLPSKCFRTPSAP